MKAFCPDDITTHPITKPEKCTPQPSCARYYLIHSQMPFTTFVQYRNKNKPVLSICTVCIYHNLQWQIEGWGSKQEETDQY